MTIGFLELGRPLLTNNFLLARRGGGGAEEEKLARNCEYSACSLIPPGAVSEGKHA